MSHFMPNYHRYGPGYGFVDAPETYRCAICGNYIDWPAEEIGWKNGKDICHAECLEKESGGQYGDTSVF